MTKDSFDSPKPAQENFDRFNRYLLPHPETGKRQAWTRATTFAKTLSDDYALKGWEARMAVKGLTMRPDLFASVSSMDINEDKAGIDKIVKSAKEAAGGSSSANLGTALHKFSERVDRGEKIDIPPPWGADIAAYREALRANSLTILPEYLERIVVCPQYNVAGRLDKIASDVSGTYILDLKTGKTVKYGVNEFVIQLALYANATHVWDPDSETYEAMPDVSKTRAIVAHTPVGTATCSLYELDLEQGWEAAQMCEAVRNWRKRKGISSIWGSQTPFTEPESESYEALLSEAGSIVELNRLGRQAKGFGLLTPELIAIGKRRGRELSSKGS